MARRSVVISGALLFLASTASAYRTAADLPEFEGGGTIAWRQAEIVYSISESGLSVPEFEKLQNAAADAFSTWHDPACSSPPFRFAGFTPESAAPDDGRNTIEWVNSGWKGRGFPADAAASTDVGYARTAGGDWEITETDLYINAEGYEWTLTADGGVDARPIASMLTHEGGHMLGLLHPCEEGGKDGAPDCASAPALRLTTMYPLYDQNQVTLTEDDRQGACFLYPAAPADAGVGLPLPDIRTGGHCEKDTECPAAATCVSQRCTPGSGQPGDPCGSAADCASRSCSPEGHCAKRCGEDTDCAAAQTCSPLDRFGAICRGGIATDGIGARCSDSSTCEGGECVARTNGGSFCSRLCAADCPAGWTCETVEGRAVCLPDLVVPAGGCSVVATAADVASPAALGAMAGALSALVLRNGCKAMRRTRNSSKDRRSMK